jgi:pseudaminic acid biosynthesis-associated methylase
MSLIDEQEDFWKKTYAEEYIRKNKEFNHHLGAEAWEKMLKGTGNQVKQILECGSNIGRNIQQLNIVLPNAEKSIIEISESAYNIATFRYELKHAFKGSILESNFLEASFDLCFTSGVLIHINPDRLLQHMEKMFLYSRKYILMVEYFNRTPISIEYQGEADKLFKCDFGKLFIENFDVKLLDYGFLWGHIYDAAGFDDMTWWLFEKHLQP